jgi:hypothetical protein
MGVVVAFKMFLVFVTRFCNGVVNFVKVLTQVAKGITFGGWGEQ